MTRTCLNDHKRYLMVYMKPYPGYYFPGDGCRRDEDGYIWITGRVDDVLNVSGHRIGTAEVESSLVGHPAVSQAAVVGFPHDIKGQGICCYVTLTVGFEESDDLTKQLKNAVRHMYILFFMYTPPARCCLGVGWGGGYHFAGLRFSSSLLLLLGKGGLRRNIIKRRAYSYDIFRGHS